MRIVHYLKRPFCGIAGWPRRRPLEGVATLANPDGRVFSENLGCRDPLSASFDH